MKKYILLVALLFTIVALSPDRQAAANDDVRSWNLQAADRYSFPIRPNSREWRSFETSAEMHAATQVPEDVLHKMSTEGLIETVLSYPLFGDMIAANNVQQGFDGVKRKFNGLSALLERPDVGPKLLMRYKRMDPAVLPRNQAGTGHSEHRRPAGGSVIFEFLFVETLLAQPEVLSTLEQDQIIELLAETLEKGRSKQDYPAIYGPLSQEATTFAMARALQQYDPATMDDLSQDEAVKQFLRGGSLTLPRTLNKVITHTQQSLGRRAAPYVEGDGDVSTFDASGVVYTPKGTPVEVIIRTWELSQREIDDCNRWFEEKYPYATRETDCTRKYNCHSYAWYSRSTSNDRWMNSPGDDTYWNDGSWIAQSYDSPYYRVSYKSDDHSAVVAYSPTGPYMYRSKWGQGPRMYHAPNYTPYDESTLQPYKRYNW